MIVILHKSLAKVVELGDDADVISNTGICDDLGAELIGAGFEGFLGAKVERRDHQHHQV